MGKTIGILGLGRIGKEVALRARAFGMKILAYDPYPDQDFASNNDITLCSGMDQLTDESDILSLHCFLSPETHGMINEERINQMRQGVIILNCARGELVDKNAMRSALENGTVGGYGADVLDTEPPAKDHPLLGAPNCIITSHIASRTYESVARQAGMATRNLIALLKGEGEYMQANSFNI